eukprot:gene2580-7000_t
MMLGRCFRITQRSVRLPAARWSSSTETSGGIAVDALGAMPKTADGARELYDTWAATYEESLRSWEYPAPSRAAETLKEHGVDSASRLLDLGCGTGMLGDALRETGFEGEIEGVDISQASLEFAMAKPGVYATTYAGSLDAPMSFLEDASYDAAVSVGVLSYVEDFATFFSETARACKPGATVVMTHRRSLWDADYRGVQAASNALVEAGEWTLEVVGDAEDYMPLNPDPTESAKKIRLLVWHVVR